jgi:hypothetical protein
MALQQGEQTLHVVRVPGGMGELHVGVVEDASSLVLGGVCLGDGEVSFLPRRLQVQMR